MVVRRIRDAAVDSALSRSPNLLVILYGWKEFVDVAEPKRFVDTLISSDEGVLRFLVGALSRVVHYQGDRVSEGWRISKESISEFCDPETLAARAARIRAERAEALSEEERRAIDAYLNPKTF